LARLVLVSNRVAVAGREAGGQPGGLAVAINSILRRHPGIWFGWSGRVMAKADNKVRTIQHAHQSYVFTDLIEGSYREYYMDMPTEVLTAASSG
jgi:trehalose 6-phosphate synthase